MTTDDYPNVATIAQLLAWHERQHEASHAQLDAAKITGSMNVVLKHRIAELVKQRDEAIAEVERLKANLERLNQELYEAKGWCQDWRPDWVRKDPSRLEIAAMLLGAQPPPQAGSFSGQAEHALRRADALIAAAKEVAK